MDAAAVQSWQKQPEEKAVVWISRSILTFFAVKNDIVSETGMGAPLA
jgi:hypothetical protein